MGQAGSRSHSLSAAARMINRVVNLIANQLNITRRGELVQIVQLGITDGRSRRIMRTINQHQLSISIHQPLDLIKIDAEIVILANLVVASLDSKRFGQSRKRRIPW